MTVYICYCYADTHLASKLALDLMRRGLNVWIDQSAEGTSQRRAASIRYKASSSPTTLC